MAFSHDASAGTIIKSPAYLGLNNGLVGCWSFDGSYTKVPDCSGNNNTGTITGATKTAGKIGQALKFDGVNDEVSVGSGITWSANQPKAVSAWFRIAKTPITPSVMIVGDATSAIDLRINDGGAIASAINETLFSFGGSVVDNAWHHVVYIYNGSAESAYLDGNKVGSSNTEAAPANSGETTIGISPFGSLDFDGLIDDVRIWNRALSANEIARLYRIGLGSTANRAQTNTILDKGLVGYWTFDGADIGTSGTIAKDRSGNNNNGTITGAVRNQGKIGQALSFDGAGDQVIVLDNDIMTFGDGSTDRPFTFVGWVKPSNFINIFSIVEKWSVPREYRFMFGDTNADFRLELHDASAGITINANSVSDDTSLAGEWHHVVATYDGQGGSTAANGITLYIDGVAIALNRTNNASYVAMENQTSNISMGDGTANGLIDDVRIYNRALSVGEIARLYNQTQSKFNSSKTDTLTNGLVGYWTFDGPDIGLSGTQAKDRSGNSNHGTLTGGASLKSVQGKVGQALSFDGVDDRVNMGDVLDFTSANLSFGAWIYPKSFGEGGGGIIIDKKDGGGTGYQFTVEGSTPNSLIYQIDGTFNASTANSIKLNQWQHVFVTHSGSSLKFYINGVLDITLTESGIPTDTASFLNIGNQTNETKTFDGLIDDVRVYNRALSDGEINKLYQMGR